MHWKGRQVIAAQCSFVKHCVFCQHADSAADALLLLLLLLLLLQTENPQWVLPDACFNASKLLKGQDEADVGDWSQPCRAAAMKPAPPECAAITKQPPLYSCSYKSLN
jgi:hypothetical protein